MPSKKTQFPRNPELKRMLGLFGKNLKSTMKAGDAEVVSNLEFVRTISCWSNALPANPSNRLLNEIFMDAYFSINFGCYGLYKYSDMALRSALENTLNLIYFSSHPKEFEWWSKGSDWYLQDSLHPWGKGYNYFKQLVNDPRANPIFDKGGNAALFSVSEVYNALSSSIHSGSLKLQTGTEKLSPSFDPARFKEYTENLRLVLSLMNSVLILGFRNEFAEMNANDRRSIAKTLEMNHSNVLRDMGLVTE